MAQTLTATACQTSNSGFFLNPPKYIQNGVIARSVQMSLSGSYTASAVLQMVPVPKGCQILDLHLAYDGGGSATYIFSVGDGNTNNRYISGVSSTVGSTIARMTVPAGAGYSYSAEDTIDITMGAAGTTSAQGVVRLTVFYAMDQKLTR